MDQSHRIGPDPEGSAQLRCRGLRQAVELDVVPAHFLMELLPPMRQCLEGVLGRCERGGGWLRSRMQRSMSVLSVDRPSASRNSAGAVTTRVFT